jgi:hypothetical protein
MHDYEYRAGIFKQSMEARNRVGNGVDFLSSLKVKNSGSAFKRKEVYKCRLFTSSPVGAVVPIWAEVAELILLKALVV